MGCGLSDKPGDDRYEYTLKSRVDDLEALIEHLALDRGLTLVLHDWGGMIGMAYATRFAHRIKRIILFNTSAFLLPGHIKFPWQLWIIRNSRLGWFMVRGLNAFSRTAAFVCSKRKPLSKQLRDAYCAPYDTWNNRIATLRFVQDIPLQPEDRSYSIVSEVQEKLSSFQDRPVLICWGEKDFVFTSQVLDVWLQYMPRAEVHRFTDCGHYILEDAADEIPPIVRRFLDKHPLTGHN
jgi:haloalkane dehalogenase